jgi:hypothetical protein
MKQGLLILVGGMTGVVLLAYFSLTTLAPAPLPTATTGTPTVPPKAAASVSTSAPQPSVNLSIGVQTTVSGARGRKAQILCDSYQGLQDYLNGQRTPDTTYCYSVAAGTKVTVLSGSELVQTSPNNEQVARDVYLVDGLMAGDRLWAMEAELDK